MATKNPTASDVPRLAAYLYVCLMLKRDFGGGDTVTESWSFFIDWKLLNLLQN